MLDVVRLLEVKRAEFEVDQQHPCSQRVPGDVPSELQRVDGSVATHGGHHGAPDGRVEPALLNVARLREGA